MNVSASASRRTLAAPGTLALLLAAALSWIVIARLPMAGMGSATAFMPAWVLMMAAMMLPAVAPVATLWSRTLKAGRGYRLTLFALGYLCAWALTAIPAYGGWLLATEWLPTHPLAARIIGAAIFAVAGLYQLTPYKDQCLKHCRSPLAQFLEYSSWQGRWGRDFAVGLHHAAYCLGCCWALMLLMLAFGTMSIAAALGLAIVICLEKLAPRPDLVVRGVGIAALVWAIVVLIHPAAAPGLMGMPMVSGT
ncbi:MAG: DUF2182 domain-containing protein [Sinobacteraceae bacterium]|nr:DUF2182 domain-containing protein [Nevskiaceae bacterium]